VYRAASAAKSAVGGKPWPVAASAYSLVEAGLHVLANKPAIIRREDLLRLEAVLGLAAERGHPGEGRDPLFNISGADQWFPACAGTTIGYRTIWPEQAFEEPEPPTREFPEPFAVTLSDRMLRPSIDLCPPKGSLMARLRRIGGRIG
jgi:hypothetical protein